MKHLITSALKGEKGTVYLDNEATTFYRPEAVVQAVADATRHTGNPGRESCGASLGAARTTHDTRVLVSNLFGLGDPCRAVFTVNFTTSPNMAIQGLFSPGDHVITTVMEHNSVLHSLYTMRERGMELAVVRVDGRRNIRYEDLERAIRLDTKRIVCIHASNLTEDVVDTGRVERIYTKASLLFVLDASQTAGIFGIHMEHVGIDVLCFTGHKSLMGPQGTERICLREGAVVRPLMAGGGGARSYQEFYPGEVPEVSEAGTVNGHGVTGLHAVLEFIRSVGMETIRCWELMLMRRFYEGVLGIPGVTVYDDFSDADHHVLAVALNIGNCDSGEISGGLTAGYGIYTRAGAHCTPLMRQTLGTVGQGAVRFSVSYYNTEEKIDQAVQVVRELAV